MISRAFGAVRSYLPIPCRKERQRGVCRHRTQTCSQGSNAPPTLLLLLDERFRRRFGMGGKDIIAFVPTFPTPFAEVYRRLPADFKAKIGRTVFKRLLLRHFAFFQWHNDYVWAAETCHSIEGYGFADKLFLCNAFVQWETMVTILANVPSYFVRTQQVIAMSSDGAMSIELLRSFPDVVEMTDDGLFVKLRTGVLPLARGDADHRFKAVAPEVLNRQLVTVCETIPQYFLHKGDIVAKNGDSLTWPQLSHTSLSHAVEFCGPFVRLHPTFCHPNRGEADNQYSDSQRQKYKSYEEHELTRPCPLTHRHRNPRLGDTSHCGAVVRHASFATDRVKVIVRSPHSAALTADALDLLRVAAQESRCIGLYLQYGNDPAQRKAPQLLVMSTPTHSWFVPLTELPLQVKAILHDPKIMKVAFDAADVCQRCATPTQGVVDIADVVLYSGWPVPTLRHRKLNRVLCFDYLGKAVARSAVAAQPSLENSNWLAVALNEEQRDYASAKGAVTAKIGFSLVGAAAAHGVDLSPIVDRCFNFTRRNLVAINVALRLRQLQNSNSKCLAAKGAITEMSPEKVSFAWTDVKKAINSLKRQVLLLGPETFPLLGQPDTLSPPPLLPLSSAAAASASTPCVKPLVPSQKTLTELNAIDEFLNSLSAPNVPSDGDQPVSLVDNAQEEFDPFTDSCSPSNSTAITTAAPIAIASPLQEREISSSTVEENAPSAGCGRDSAQTVNQAQDEFDPFANTEVPATMELPKISVSKQLTPERPTKGRDRPCGSFVQPVLLNAPPLPPLMPTMAPLPPSTNYARRRKQHKPFTNDSPSGIQSLPVVPPLRWKLPNNDSPAATVSTGVSAPLAHSTGALKVNIDEIPTEVKEAIARQWLQDRLGK